MGSGPTRTGMGSGPTCTSKSVSHRSLVTLCRRNASLAAHICICYDFEGLKLQPSGGGSRVQTCGAGLRHVLLGVEQV
eukprot:350512-Chlamydomonas_euryale.AAC.2